MLISFKEWLKKEFHMHSPEGPGDIWSQHSNVDQDFGRTGAKSKNVMSNKSGQVDFDPDELFLGKKSKKKCRQINKDTDILGGYL